MSVEKCKSKALRYVAMQVKTEGQVADYLRRKEFASEEIEAALEFLREYKYVDDRHYCRSYYIEACGKGRGRRRIEQDLAAKKVSRNLIRKTLDEFLSEENPDYDDLMREILPEKERALKTAIKLLTNQLESGKEADKNFMAKVGRRLMSLGYGSDIIYATIGTLMKEAKKLEQQKQQEEDLL